MPSTRARSPTTEELSALRDAIDRLTDHVDRLTLAVDELFVQMEWSNNQRSPDYVPDPPFVLTSLPLDPAATDWQINRVRPEDLPTSPAPSESATGRLF